MAMAEWVTNVTINFGGNGLLQMSRLASATKMANVSMQAQSGIITRNQAAMAAYTERIEALRLSAIRLGTAFASIGAGMGLAAIGYGVGEAAKFQRAMTGVFVATSGASAAQRAAMQRQAIDVSGWTAQSAVTIANEMSAAAQTAFKDPKTLMTLFPTMAKYADVRFMASGGTEDPTRTVEQMTQFSHLFQAYGLGAMQRMLDLASKLQFTAHLSLQQLVTQGRMFIPNAVQSGVSEDTLFQWIAIAAQNGFMQGRGGTAINNVLLNALAVTPTAHLSKAKDAALRDLDLRNPDGSFRFLDAHGHIMAEPMMKYLQSKREEMIRDKPRLGNSQWMSDIGAIFGKEGQRFVSVVAAQTTRDQMNRNTTAFARIPGVDGQWEAYRHDLFYQVNAFKTNVHNLAMALALPELPTLTVLFRRMSDQLGVWVQYLTQHPVVAGTIGKIIAGTTAVLTGSAVAGLGALAIGPLKTAMGGVRALVGGGAAGAAGVARGGAMLGGAGGMLASVLSFTALRGLFGQLGGFFGSLAMRIPAVSKAVAWLTPILDEIGLKFFGLRLYAAVAGEWLAKLGLRFVPVIGEVLLLIDGLNFLRTHMKNVGFAIGEVAGWMIKNMPGVFAAVGRLGVDLMKGLLVEIIAVINPVNWIHAIQDLIAGVSAGLKAATARPSATRPAVHPVVVRPHREPTREVVRHQPTTVNVTVNVDARGGGTDPRKIKELHATAAAHAFSKAGIHRVMSTAGGDWGGALGAAHS